MKLAPAISLNWIDIKFFQVLFTVLPLILTFHINGLAMQNPEELPDIILLLGDDHGWDETSYNGHPFLKTPELDKMATEGLRMDRFYAASPVCSPTRGSIITGRHPNRYGTFSPGYSIRPEEISIAQLMKQAGYATAHFGKWHLGPVKKNSPTNPGAMGFDEWLSHDNFFEMNPIFSRNGKEPTQFKGESSEVLVKEAIRFMKKSKERGKPFFVVIWYGSPHEPYSGLEKDLALYKNLPDSIGNKTVRLTSNETGLQINRLQRNVLQERYAEITAMDRSIGTLRTFLEEEKNSDNTLIWYFGDNGTPQEGVATLPLREQKGSIYDGGLRVPAVLVWPAKIRPQISPLLSVSSDVFPTLTAIIGQPLPKRPIDGINLLPLIEEQKNLRPNNIKFWNSKPGSYSGSQSKPYINPELQEGTTPLVKLANGLATRNFINYTYPLIREEDYRGPRAILENQYKLVIHEDKAGIPVRELFDIRTDPAETSNLISQHPDLAAKLERQLIEWQKSVLNSLRGHDYIPE